MKSTTEGLYAIFDIVNDWLKFAEQKTGAIIVLNSGLSWGITRFSQIFLDNTGIVAMISIGILSLSTLICIISFLPILKSKLCQTPRKKTGGNCTYFGDIAGMDCNEFCRAYAMKNEVKACEIDAFGMDVISQIITNSKIALEKFLLTKIASWITMFGIMSFPAGIVFSLN